VERPAKLATIPGSKHAETLPPTDIVNPSSVSPKRTDEDFLKCDFNQRTQIGRIRGSHNHVWAAFQGPFTHKLAPGAMSGVDCHNPPGSFLAWQIRSVSANVPNCYQYHSDLRGPFVSRLPSVPPASTGTSQHGCRAPRYALAGFQRTSTQRVKHRWYAYYSVGNSATRYYQPFGRSLVGFNEHVAAYAEWHW
jgi:hypothetical protein